MAYHRYHGVDTKIVRIFNTYGPRMRVNDGRAVPAFMSQALRNEDVTIFGDGSQTRSFTYVTDLVDGIIKLMLSSENDPVNIGNPVEMTIKQIAETIIQMTGSKSKIVYRPLPTDDPKQRRPDITRARTLLGWEPKVQLNEGLVKTIEYFRTKVGGQVGRVGRVGRRLHVARGFSPRERSNSSTTIIGSTRRGAARRTTIPHRSRGDRRNREPDDRVAQDIRVADAV